jgi:hypothetical protein
MESVKWVHIKAVVVVFDFCYFEENHLGAF